MSGLDPSIDELRTEFAENDVRGWIWLWLERHLHHYAAKRIRGRLSATMYSPSGEWDADGLSDLVSEFIIEKGIQRAAVAKALAAASDTEGALRYLRKAFKHFVISERPRSLTRNIFDRVRDVLDDQPDFMRLAGVPPGCFYGLADWEEDPPRPASDEQLKNAARFLPEDISWVSYTKGTRHSPGLASRDLERAIHSLFVGLGYLLSARQIMSVIEQRYQLRQEATLEHDVGGLATVGSSPLEDVEATDLAERALKILSQRQRKIVRLMLDDPAAVTVRDVAAKLGLSKSTASTELRAIQGHFRDLGASTESIQKQILDLLGPLLRAS
jgi:hypothetical protein